MSTSNWLSSSLSTAYNTLTRSTTDTLEAEDDGLPSLPPSPRSESFSTPTHASYHVKADGSFDLPNTSAGNPQTPRSRAADSEVLSSILQSHPSFSVFRKSASQQSLQSIAEVQVSADCDHPGVQEDEEEEVLRESNPERDNRPYQHQHHRADCSLEEGGSEEWHLSSVEDMASLNFGDRSSSVSPVSVSHSSIRLLPNDSPPASRRVSSQIQFSPLQLAPSPLLSNPPPPPPPTTAASSSPSSRPRRMSESPSDRALQGVKTILKLPRTPGTGQSVRFSASTRTRTSTASPLGESLPEADQEVSSGELSRESSTEEVGEGSLLEISSNGSGEVVSFLSRLQAAIPSPETSFCEPPSSNINPNLKVTVPSPSTVAYTTGPISRTLVGNDSNIFDTSAPHFGASKGPGDWSVADWKPTPAATKVPAEKLTSMKEEEEGPLPAPSRSTNDVLSSPPTPQPTCPPTPEQTVDAAPTSTNALVSPSCSQLANVSTTSSTSTSSSSSSGTSSTSSRVSNTFATPDRTHKASAFYRQFLQKRSNSSIIAADELGRIVELSPGTKASPPKRESPEERVMEEKIEEVKNADVARHEDTVEEYEEDEDARVEASLLREEAALSGSIVERSARLLLSPIAEVSETSMSVISSPARTVWSQASPASSRRLFFSPTSHFTDSPSSKKDAGNTVTPSPSKEMTLFNSASPHSTSPAPHRRSQSDIGTPSYNPFATQGADPGDLGLIHSLLTAQGDMLANTSTQRFLLSSLITNLRGEIDRKDAMLRNVQAQNAELEDAYREAAREADAWEQAARDRMVSESEQAKIFALDELVVRLTTELETRTANERRMGSKLDGELKSLRDELHKARSDARDADIRVRHAQADQGRAEEARIHVEREGDELRLQLGATVGETELLRRERDDLRARMRNELEERDRVIESLRAELVTRAKLRVGGPDEESRAQQLQRELDHARLTAAREAAVLDTELKSQWHLAELSTTTIADLRTQNRALKEELTEATDLARRTRAAAETARLESRTEHSRLRSELAELRRKAQSLEEDLEEAHSRMEKVEAERNTALADLDARRATWEESIAAQRGLMDSISVIEADAADKVAALTNAQAELETLRHDMNELLDARDRRLGETQAALATRTAKSESLQVECTRLKELVKVLRQESADKEVKIVKLRKIKAELNEDIVNLNIALDSKQQETAMFKRQLHATRNGLTPVATTVARSSVADVQFSSHATRDDTPSKIPQRPKLGVSNRRTLSSDLTPSVGGKENNLPSSTVASVARSRSRSQLVAA